MPVRQLPIRELLNDCLNGGSEEQWSEFIERIHPLVAGVVFKTACRCAAKLTDTADDLVQEVFLRLLKDEKRNLRNFNDRDQESLFGYIKVVTATVVYDHFKFVSAGKRSQAAEEELDHDHLAAPVRGDLRLIGFDIERVLDQERVSSRNREIFWMYFRQGFSAKEIADMSDGKLSIKGVQSCLKRLTDLLRQRLGEAQG